jgi:hypothetical protein
MMPAMMPPSSPGDSAKMLAIPIFSCRKTAATTSHRIAKPGMTIERGIVGRAEPEIDSCICI